MALPVLDRVIWRAASSGTGAFVVASAITGYIVPADALNPAAVDYGPYSYFAQSDDLTQWEVGIGVYDIATTTLARTTILNSSNAGAVVTFSAAPTVFMGAPLASVYITQGITDQTYGTGVDIFGGDGTTDGGGAITVLAGDTTDQNGGLVLIRGGDSSSGNGGNFNAQGGNSASASGGMLSFVGGTGDTDGGFVNFESGTSGSGPGGDINFTTGGSFGAAQGGDIKFNYGAGGTRNGLFFPNLPTSDPGVSGAAWVDGVTVKISP